MPLPNDNVRWPPVSMQGMYSRMSEWAAWYSGDPERLVDAYAGTVGAQGAIPWWRFWSRARQGRDGTSQRSLLHVPLASDLAQTSAALLFGSPAVVRIRDAREEDDEEADPAADPTASPKKPRKKPLTAAQKAEERLLQIIEDGGVNERLIAAAETAAAIGGVYLYPVWDKDLRPFPMLAVAQSDQAAPTFRHGVLTSVTFFKTVLEEGNRVVRLVETHEVEGEGASRKAVVLSAVYDGVAGNLGSTISDAGMESIVGFRPEPRVELPFAELDVEYVPNQLPNRIWRASSLGVPDIQGSESFLDALDETYASWMRDVRLAKARILVPREYLRMDSTTGTVPTFDIDQEIYVGLDMEPGLSSDARAMMAHQFEIRHQAHSATARELIERIVSNAGYKPDTLGPTSGSGPAMRISEHRTLLTLRRRSAWWRRAISHTLYRMMLIDEDVFDGPTVSEEFRPTVTMTDSIIDNPLELAQTALALKTAEAASLETRVRTVHPDWSETEVDAEVKRIQDELGAAKPAPPMVVGSGGPGKFGDPTDDPAGTAVKPTTGGPQGPTPPNPPPPSPPMARNAG